ncbi:electron transfer flavoprotein [Streptomonospora alba]|uniref:Electron transfer flavoprotein n=1 Tax=Streptomonospora alba TaxID=183763 RepID=A0A0C2FFL9_9ACTN|nr:FAD-dependent oxidoreductase [Streptomonospora alba]KIH98034.1 electron transfer flavoprotein [Streptomonospora alba]
MTCAVRHLVVIGNGMVGARFAEEVARRDPDGRRCRVTVVGAEAGGAYNRVLLPGVVAGDYTLDDIRLPEPETPSVRVRTGVAARAIDPRRKTVALDDGTRLNYDRLVLATGARARVPPVAGIADEAGRLAAGVSTLRDIADCRRLMAQARPGGAAAVLGGGVLGLEIARALAGRGVRCTVVEAMPWIMHQEIDEQAAEVLSRRYGEAGVAVCAGQAAARWHPTAGLELDDGRTLAAEALVLTTGVRGSTELADAAGIATDHGVLVDDELASSEPGVYAIGDCAQHPAGGAGLVQPGWEQAAVLADRLTGTGPGACYTGVRPVTRLKAEGIELAAMGRLDTGDPVLTIDDFRAGRYARLSAQGDLVTGAVLLGFPRAAGTLGRLFATGSPLPAEPLALFHESATAAADTGEEEPVCRCNAVSRDRIEAAWRDGARSRTSVAERTRATTGCGECARDVDALLSAWSGGDAASRSQR